MGLKSPKIFVLFVLFSLIFAFFVLLPTHVILTSRTQTKIDASLRRWGDYAGSELAPAKWEEMRQELHRRSIFYHDEVLRTHLVKGMVVNRTTDGEALDLCDSLLFSSLLYVGLRNLGEDLRAKELWRAINRSRDGPKWWRHPDCRRAISRDMILGLLVAISQLPAGASDLVRDLLVYTDINRGFFGEGHLGLSNVTPGLGEALRRVRAGMKSDLDAVRPFFFDFSFSTIEFDSNFVGRGYQAHLIGLSLWLEMQLEESEVRSPIAFLDRLFDLFTLESLMSQRQRYVAGRLVQIDPYNLFFRWLKISSVGSINHGTRSILASDLLRMPQFPEDRLPKDCDRKADYLWQRNSVEYLGRPSCRRIYNAVDFIWLAGLLYADSAD